jgi:hypothetical protein
MATLPPTGLPTGTNKLEYIKELVNDLAEDLKEELYLPDGVYSERDIRDLTNDKVRPRCSFGSTKSTHSRPY